MVAYLSLSLIKQIEFIHIIKCGLGNYNKTRVTILLRKLALAARSKQMKHHPTPPQHIPLQCPALCCSNLCTTLRNITMLRPLFLNISSNFPQMLVYSLKWNIKLPFHHVWFLCWGGVHCDRLEQMPRRLVPHISIDLGFFHSSAILLASNPTLPY